MENEEIKTLQLLDALERDGFSTQRTLAKKLDVSLGLVNSFIKRLVHKGYVKITTIPRNRIKYILTPVGVAEKTQLTYDYVQHSYKFYKVARSGFRNLFETLEAAGVYRVVLYGVNPLSEIAFISVQETGLEISGVVDDEHVGERFMRIKVLASDRLRSTRYDRLLITGMKSREKIESKLVDLEVPAWKIVGLDHSIFPILQ